MELICEFDRVFRADPGWPAPPRPTEESLAEILRMLGLPGLPSHFVRLARESEYFGTWFGSLGPDFEGSRHTLGLNRYWRQEGLPESLFLMTYGFDAVCDCLDLESSADPDNFQVVQVQVGFGEIDSRHLFAPDFTTYLEKINDLFRDPTT